MRKLIYSLVGKLYTKSIFFHFDCQDSTAQTQKGWPIDVLFLLQPVFPNLIYIPLGPSA